MILLIVVIALVLITWGILRGSNLEDRAQFPTMKYSSKVDRIEINDPTNSAKLVKQEDVWYLEEDAVLLPADNEAIEQILSLLDDFPFKELVSTNQEKYVDFQIGDNEATKVTWYQGEDLMGELYFGKSDFQRQGDFVRLGKSIPVYLTSGNIRYTFSRPDFKDLNFLRLTQDQLKEIAWNYGETGEQFKLFRKQAPLEGATAETGLRWFLSMAEGEELLVDDAKVQPTVDYLTNITARSLQPLKPERDYGFNAPFYQITVISSNGDELALTFGNQADEEPAYYAQISDRKNFVYLLNIALVDDQLKRHASDFIAAAGEELPADEANE